MQAKGDDHSTFDAEASSFSTGISLTVMAGWAMAKSSKAEMTSQLLEVSFSVVAGAVVALVRIRPLRPPWAGSARVCCCLQRQHGGGTGSVAADGARYGLRFR
jgi:hypothetical protein